MENPSFLVVFLASFFKQKIASSGLFPDCSSLGGPLPLRAQSQAFGVFPLFLPLAIAASGGSEGYFSLAIIAFGASENIEIEEPRFLNLSLWSSRIFMKDPSILKTLPCSDVLVLAFVRAHA